MCIYDTVMFEPEIAVTEFIELQHGKQQERQGKRATDDLHHQQSLFPPAAVVADPAERQCHGNRGENTRRDKRCEGKCGEDDEQRHPDTLQGEEFGHRRPGNLQHLFLQGPQQESGHDDRSEGQYGGFGTENAEDVRRPAPPTLSMAMVFERLTNVEIEIST